MTEPMRRDSYRLFSPGSLGRLPTKNRLVRSATWDPAMVFSRQADDETVDTYRALALGGVGTIIVGDFNVVPTASDDVAAAVESLTYDDVRIRDYARVAAVVHQSAPGCRIVAQLSGQVSGKAPSAVHSPLTGRTPQELTAAEIRALVRCFVVAIAGVREDGFDGAQLHAAHGSLLSRFLSPYSNRRRDEHGGSPAGRARVICEIVEQARGQVGNFPILIKMNATDYLEDGLDSETLRAQAAIIAKSGIDAIELSGGMWECLLRPERELGFPPVPAPESHIRISDPAKQSYFLSQAREIDVDVPVALGGGHRDVERVERILREGAADFISLSRPLIREPELPRRWLEGRGPTTTACVSCNACIYDMWTSIGRGEPGHTRCLAERESHRLREAREWLAGWVEANTRRCERTRSRARSTPRQRRRT